MRIAILVLAIAAAPLVQPALSAGSIAAPDGRQPRIDMDPVYSPRLSRLQSTKLRYIGEGAEEVFVPPFTRRAMPGLSATMLCKGRRSCFLEATIEAQVTGAEGAMGFDVLVDGNPMDVAIGSVQLLVPGSYVMAQRRFMLELRPGLHDIDVVIYGTADFSYVRHSAAYRLYRK